MVVLFGALSSIRSQRRSLIYDIAVQGVQSAKRELITHKNLVWLNINSLISAETEGERDLISCGVELGPIWIGFANYSVITGDSVIWVTGLLIQLHMIDRQDQRISAC